VLGSPDMTLDRDQGAAPLLHERLTVVEDDHASSSRRVQLIARALGSETTVVTIADLQANLPDSALLHEFRPDRRAPTFDRSLAAVLLSGWQELDASHGADQTADVDDAEVAAAQDRLDRATEQVEVTNRNTGSGMFEPEVRRAIEAAHDRALGLDESEPRRKLGIGSRRRREEARAELDELLAECGFTTYEDFVLTTASASVDSGARDRLREAVKELEEAQQALVAAMGRASSRRNDREATLAGLRSRTELYLGVHSAGSTIDDHELIARLQAVVSPPPEPLDDQPTDEIEPVNLAAAFEDAKAYLASAADGRAVIIDHALRALPTDVTRPLLDWLATGSPARRVVVLSDQKVVKVWARRLDPSLGAYADGSAESKTQGSIEGPGPLRGESTDAAEPSSM
jgi:hypothetical protein